MNWGLPGQLRWVAKNLNEDDPDFIERAKAVIEEAAKEIEALREYTMTRKWPVEIIEEGDRANG